MPITTEATSALKSYNVLQIVRSFVDGSDTKWFAFLSNPVDPSLYPDNRYLQIDNVDNSDENFSNAWNNMVGCIRLTKENCLPLVRRIDWEQDKVFTQYSDIQDLQSEDYYCINSQYRVYKCISNANGSSSTIEPDGITTDLIKTSDGYLWKFLFQVPEKNEKFLTDSWIPLDYDLILDTRLAPSDADTQKIVQLAAIPGSILNYTIGNSTTSFTNVEPDPISISAVSEDGNQCFVYLGNDGSSSDGAYTGYALVVENGTIGEGQYALITDYQVDESATDVNRMKRIVLDRTFIQPLKAGNTKVKILPYVKVVGDGFDAFAVATVDNDNIVNGVNVINQGRGYSWATASIPSPMNDVVISPIVSPISGHGGNLITELNASALMVYFDMDSSVVTDLPNHIVFRKVGLMVNPKKFGTNDILGTDLDTVDFIRVETENSLFTDGDYIINQTITGQETNSHGTVLKFEKDPSDPTYGDLVILSPSGKWKEQEATTNIIVEYQLKRISFVLTDVYTPGNDYIIGETVTDGAGTGVVVDWIAAPSGQSGSRITIDVSSGTFDASGNLVGATSGTSYTPIPDDLVTEMSEGSDVFYTANQAGEVIELELLNNGGTAGYTSGSDFAVGSVVYQGPTPPAYGEPDAGVTNDVSSARVCAWIPGSTSGTGTPSKLYIRNVRGEPFAINTSYRVGPFGSDTSRIYQVVGVSSLKTIKARLSENYVGDEYVIGEEVENSSASASGIVIEWNPAILNSSGSVVTVAVETGEFVVGDTIESVTTSTIYTIDNIGIETNVGKGKILSSSGQQLEIMNYLGEPIVTQSVNPYRYISNPERTVQYYVDFVMYNFEQRGEILFTPQRMVEILITDPILTTSDSEYTSLNAWTSTTQYTSNDIVKPSSANDFVYQCIKTGYSGAYEPTWPTTYGDDVIDDDFDTWASLTSYNSGDLVIPSTPNGYAYIALTTGTSDSTEPTWPDVVGDSVVDDGVTWECVEIAEWITISFGQFNPGQVVYMGDSPSPSFPDDKLVQGTVKAWFPVSSGGSILLLQSIQSEVVPFIASTSYQIGVAGGPFYYNIAQVTEYENMTKNSSSLKSRVVSYERSTIDASNASGLSISEIRNGLTSPQIYYRTTQEVTIYWSGVGSPSSLTVGDILKGETSEVSGYIGSVLQDTGDTNRFFITLVSIQNSPSGSSRFDAQIMEKLFYISGVSTTLTDYIVEQVSDPEVERFSGEILTIEPLQTAVQRSENSREELQIVISFGS